MFFYILGVACFFYISAKIGLKGGELVADYIYNKTPCKVEIKKN